MKQTTLKLTLTASLTALAFIANTFSVPIFGTTNYLSFVYIPCFIAGIYLGAIHGFAVGLIGDILGHLLHPMGVYNPLIGLASALLGVIPALIFKLPKLNNWLKMILSFVLCMIICTSGLNTLALWLMYGIGKKTFFVYLFARLPFQLLVIVLNCIVMLSLKQSGILDRLFYNALHIEKSKSKLSSSNDTVKNTTNNQDRQ